MLPIFRPKKFYAKAMYGISSPVNKRFANATYAISRVVKSNCFACESNMRYFTRFFFKKKNFIVAGGNYLPYVARFFQD